MSIKRRQYSKEQKEEIVQKALSGKSVLELGKENNISLELINRWKKQYIAGELKGNNDNQEIKNLQIIFIIFKPKICVNFNHVCFLQVSSKFHDKSVKLHSNSAIFFTAFH